MVIPVHDVNPVSRRPVVTYTLIVINVVAFVLGPAGFTWLGGTSAAELCQLQAYFLRYGAIPWELLNGSQLAAVVGPAQPSPPDAVSCLLVPPDYEKIPFLSVLTALFVHGGWAHLLGNMLYLYVFGNNVEDRLGRLRYLLFYLTAGYVSAYGFALVNAGSKTPMVGASGAIAGVLGAYLMMFPRARVWSLVPLFFFIPLRLPAWFVLGLWFVIQWLYSQGQGLSGGADVAYLAHVVGFVVGMVYGGIVGPPRQPPTHASYNYWTPPRR